MLYSPNGKPLNGGPLGKPTCKEAMNRWFDSVDANHDGGISQDEFMADASAQFQRMDIDKNGYLLPEELERYRMPYRQNATTGKLAYQPPDANRSSGQARPHRWGHHDATEDEGRSNGASISSLNSGIDPVMSADIDNDFKVTFAEFMAQATRTFADLDTEHDSFVSREEIMKRCAHESTRQ